MEREFDRVVFDAPATGHLRTLLGVPMAVQRAVQVGPVNHVAGRIRDLLLDTDRTHVCVATLAEEMPVREAQDLVTLYRSSHCRVQRIDAQSAAKPQGEPRVEPT